MLYGLRFVGLEKLYLMTRIDKLKILKLLYNAYTYFQHEYIDHQNFAPAIKMEQNYLDTCLNALIEQGLISKVDEKIYLLEEGKKWFIENSNVNTLTPIEMLNKALEWFAMDIGDTNPNNFIPRENASKNTLLNDMTRTFIELDTTDFLLYSDLILNKLVDEKYLNYYKESGIIGMERYSITFDGKLFSKDGGYIKQSERELIRIKNLETDEALKKRNEKWTVYGAWVAGVSTALLFLTELGKILWHHRHYFCA
jgi:hypothetical protein